MKHKSRSIRLTALFLLLVMLCPVLAGCKTPGTDAPEATETEKSALKLNEEFVIVYSEQASEEETAAVTALKDGIKATTGVELKMKTDTVNKKVQKEAEYEILVGGTVRKESSVYMPAPDSYIIRLIGNRLVIRGFDAAMTKAAIDAFLAECISADGFTFTEDPDIFLNTQKEALLGSVRPYMRGTLKADTQNIINPDIIGGGVNFDFSSYVFINLCNGGEWGTGPLRSQHIPYSHSKKVADSLWKEYCGLIDETGMQYVRLNVSFTMWEPINDNDDPFDTDFDSGFIFSPDFSKRDDIQSNANGFPDLNYAYLDAFYRLLDHFEERGLFVILANWDNGSEALGFCPDKKNWLASVDSSGAQLGRGKDLNVNSLDEYAETFAAIMYHLKEEKKYSCVKGFSFYNEPENLNKAPSVLAEVYNKFGEHLERLGIRDEVMIQAFDGSITWMAADGGSLTRIPDMEKKCGDNMDIYSLHWYHSTVESGEMIGKNDVRGVISEHLIPEVKRLVEQAGDKPLILGELGTFAFQQGDGPDGRAIKDYRTRIFAAEAAIQLFNAGVKGYGLWIYNCYYHSYHTMLDYDPSDPQRIVPDKQYFYPSALIMKYLPSGTDIISSEVIDCDDDYRHVWACVGIRPDGKQTILAVNEGTDSASLTLEGLGSTKYDCWFVDPEHTDHIYYDGPVTNTTLLRPNSIVVLTER